ncbi:MAG: hypothetical protein BMS9Abin17_1372 [Acidimicrobiia bacterium]|nr:MAG: hypothetical protein BMS9Abin17_1372 [Acidimicrobiia bacterium]
MTDANDSYKRSWIAIVISTVVMATSYGSFLLAIVATRSDTPQAAGPAFALAFALVPITLISLAFLSGRDRAAMAVLKAMGLWLLVALPLGLFNPVFGLSAGFGMGGVLTLKERENNRRVPRSVAVLLVSTYSLLMLFMIPALGLVSGGLLPLAALGLADYYTEHRAIPQD